MTEKPRITLQFQMNPDGIPSGVDLWLNPAGLALVVDRLKSLSESNDHFHLFSPDLEPDGELSVIPYNRDAVVGHHLKVLLRPDKWDREYYPHVFVDQEESEET